MNHVVTEPKPGELGVGCKCGQRFPTKKTAEGHVADQNLIEENEAKAQAAKAAEAQAAELAHQAHEAEPAMEPEAPAQSPIATEPPTERKPGDGEAQPEAPQPTAEGQQPQQLGPSSLPLDINNLSLNQIHFIGQTMAKSGMFPDVRDASKALTKILAGQEIGVTPFQAMTSIHIIQGKATMGAHLMAAKVKGSVKYDYRILEHTNETCSILFRQRDQYGENGWIDLGKSNFTMDDAKRAELVKPGSGWIKYPQAMLFARAISAGCRTYTPDVFNGNLVYVPEEMGAQVDADGEVIQRAA